ncbi:acyl carrier protein [Azospirillum thermophilum]|uniref:D-alanyl carrier protein n=1 Tax=Azospirillum thermophilum TaxID=2202148 RepID=A0A2S2CUY0_9PROT|nr:acyl carrier protein [Azospirillum thermophilum]AWK88334.1 D-alanyl carrier protein [Azospirillum thermophilum]
MANSTHIRKIVDFMARAFQRDDVPVDEDIFASGFATSLFAMQLVDFVEREFGITVEAEDLELDNFRSVAAVAALVERKTARAA